MEQVNCLCKCYQEFSTHKRIQHTVEYTLTHKLTFTQTHTHLQIVRQINTHTLTNLRYKSIFTWLYHNVAYLKKNLWQILSISMVCVDLTTLDEKDYDWSRYYFFLRLQNYVDTITS